MANVLCDLFQGIANAIRSKTGSTDRLCPSDFPAAINSISGGGADVDEIDFTLDQINGEVIGENLYHVTFIGADGAELAKVPVFEDYDCVDPVASGQIGKPTKASSGYYQYSHSGWSDTQNGTASATVLKGITSDKTVYATFTASYLFKVSGVWDKLFWGIHNDNTLRIYGSGQMKYQSGGNYPWTSYKSTVTRIIIDAGVTVIAASAFQDFTALTSVSLPDDGNKDNKIAFMDSAFYGCASLKNITITANVWTIYQRAFQNSGLESAVFARPDGWRLDDADNGQLVYGLDDPATAATLLKDTHILSYWVNRWFA